MNIRRVGSFVSLLSTSAGCSPGSPVPRGHDCEFNSSSIQSQSNLEDLRPDEMPVFSARGFVPPADLLQMGVSESPYPMIPGRVHEEEWRVWWTEDLAPENGMAKLWKDPDSGAMRGRYFAWRTRDQPDGLAPDVYFTDERCIHELTTDYISACEIFLSPSVDWEAIGSKVERLLASDPQGDALGGRYHAPELYVEALQPGRSRIVRYERWEGEGSEFRNVREVRDAFLLIYQEAARSRPRITPPAVNPERYINVNDVEACIAQRGCWNLIVDKCVSPGTGQCPTKD